MTNKQANKILSAMTVKEIQSRLDPLPKLMNVSGFKDPDAHVSFRSNNSVVFYASWYEDHNYRSKTFPTLPELEKWVNELPSRDERNKKEFLQSLSDIIAKGREIGIDVEYVNPLVETMKKLSSNIITHVKGD